MAAEGEVLEITGYPIGAVGPFGLRTPVRILVDGGVLKEQQVSIGSGMRGRAVILERADLMRALGNPQVVDLIEPAP
jgi:prolyl-tRNA editing enzyme YbaK/EbsC (Cys-tRNA(Pro) deacylase)